MTESVRLYDRNFAIAFLSQTSFVCANTLMAHYARWIEFLGGDLSDIGWIMGLGTLFGLLLRPWMAQWIGRLGARTMWAVGYATVATAALANLCLTDLGLAIYVVRCALAVGTAIVFTSGLTYITQTTPESRRTEAIGIFGIGGFVGMMIGPFVGDLFLDERSRMTFASLFCLAAIANLIPMAALFLLRPSQRSGQNTPITIGEFARTCKEYWPGSIVLVDFAFGVCMTVPFIFMASFIDKTGLSIAGVSELGLFFIFYAGTATVVRFSSRRLPDRLGNARVLMFGMAFMSIGMWTFVIVDASEPWKMLIPAVLCGVGHGLMFHTMTSLTLRTFPAEFRGAGSTLALMMLDLGTIIGAPVLGRIGEAFEFSTLFVTAGTTCVLCGVAWLIGNRRLLDQ